MGGVGGSVYGVEVCRDAELRRTVPPPRRLPLPDRLTRREFDALLARFAAPRPTSAPAATPRAATASRAAAPPAPAAATPTTPADRLLMALMWLRVYPTYEVLGFFFALHKRNAQLNVRAALEVLDALSDFPFDRPGPDRKKLRCAAEVMAAFPQVRAHHRRQGAAHQQAARRRDAEAVLLGQEEGAHVKTQVVVDPRGQIEAVSELGARDRRTT